MPHVSPELAGNQSAIGGRFRCRVVARSRHNSTSSSPGRLRPSPRSRRVASGGWVPWRDRDEWHPVAAILADWRPCSAMRRDHAAVRCHSSRSWPVRWERWRACTPRLHDQVRDLEHSSSFATSPALDHALDLWKAGESGTAGTARRPAAVETGRSSGRASKQLRGRR